MKAITDTSKFMKDMQAVVEYSVGFLDGAKSGQQQLLNNVGEKTLEILNAYIDSNARVNPSMLQHVYEWYASGSPAARLFDLKYSVRGTGLTIGYTFRQSSSIKAGSKTPFYDKARIMEEGIPVTISPRPAGVLAFEQDGKTVFTKNPVVVSNPGGDAAQGGFQRAFDDFFNNYFSQAFLNSSGMLKHLRVPIEYNISRARGGKSAGTSAGYKWITKAIN